jgi:hypothetical protein
VQVHLGKVELSSVNGESRNAQSPPRIIRAGEAFQIARTANGDFETSPRPFDAQWGGLAAVQTGPRRLMVAGAMASSDEGPKRGANMLINGHGLTGDKHSNNPDESMWSSGPDKIKGEFVLFDLGFPRLLHSMKVWNYNELAADLFRYRGTAQADIYVSATGKGDPIETPADWTLIAADVKFRAADGTPDFSTPDVIDMKRVTARFAAIVIDDHFGADPRQEFPERVGLSEVQFWGERLVKESQSNPPEK